MKTFEQLKPSDFCDHPFGSVSQKCECEIVARNIMIIRKQLGDKWPLTWSEYKACRIACGKGFSDEEKRYFNEVVLLIADPLGAVTFSPKWASAARKAMA